MNFVDSSEVKFDSVELDRIMQQDDIREYSIRTELSINLSFSK